MLGSMSSLSPSGRGARLAARAVPVAGFSSVPKSTRLNAQRAGVSLADWPDVPVKRRAEEAAKANEFC